MVFLCKTIQAGPVDHVRNALGAFNILYSFARSKAGSSGQAIARESIGEKISKEFSKHRAIRFREWFEFSSCSFSGKSEKKSVAG